MPDQKPDPKAARRAAEAKLKQAKDRKLRKKIGPAMATSEAGLDAAAEVTEVDIASADALWRRYAPPKFKDLLDAEVVE